MDAKVEKEILGRLRRVETRITKFLISQGFDTETSVCEYNSEFGAVTIPSMHVTLQDVLAAIPSSATRDWDDISIEHKGLVVGFCRKV